MNETQDVQPVQPKVMAISSGKGGVGKTFVSVHLAARAAQQGLRTLLLDADLGLANVDVMLGISSQNSIHDIVHKGAAIQDIIVPARQGFDVIPGGSGLSDLASLSPDHQCLFLSEMETLNRDYDLVLIDTAAGIGENVLYFSSSAQSVLVVLTPDPTSLTDAYALIKVLSTQRHVRRFMVVVNKADQLEAERAFQRLQKVCDHYLEVFLDYVGYLPASNDVVRCIQMQQLLFDQGRHYQQLEKVLDTVLERPVDEERSSRLQFFWQFGLSENLQGRY